MKKPINIGIVGCGNIVNRHIAAIKNHKKLKLSAVCDQRKERADMIANANRCKAYYDYSQMVKDRNIDLLSICTPSHLHALMTILAAKNKKHIITEKPIALTLKDARNMIGICKKEKVKLFVVNQRRFNWAIQKTCSAIKKKKLGKILMANVALRWSRPQSYYNEEKWRRKENTGGGVLLNQAVHFIDFLQWFCGEPSKLFAVTRTLNHDIQAEDSAIATLFFKNGTIGSLEATTSIFGKNMEASITLIGEKGTIKIGGNYADKIVFWNVKNDPESTKISKADTPSSGHTAFYGEVYKELVGKKSSVSIDGEESLKSLKIILACYKSAKLSKLIKI